VAASIGRLFICILFCPLLPSPGFSQSIPPLNEILKRVGDKVQTIPDTMPDFECRETVRQRTSYKKGQRPTEERTGESIVRYFRFPQQWQGFTERREYISINGKQIAKDGKAPEGLFGVYGASSNLPLIFASHNQKFHDFKIAGLETIQNRHVSVVIFSTIKGHKEEISGGISGKVFLCTKISGKAWLDLDSMQVIRIELKLLDAPANITFAVDYAKVDIAGKEFWLAKLVKNEISEKGRRWNIDYTAEYSDYRKFDVSTDVKYGPVVQ
jgi:hypothetical protein